LRGLVAFVTMKYVPELATAAVSGPRILGRYAVYDAIASGGMATVHYGRLLGPVGFSRTVAVKRLHPQFAQDPEFVTMFLDEARLAARIRHPNVVATLDVVATANEIFLVMDYVHGESLTRILREVAAKEQRVPLPVALRIAADALQGLHAAHEARDERGTPLNIVHRDISPQNILLGIDGIARLVDFGVAKAAGRAQTTRDGQIKGKLGYMAPEQVRAGKITRQTDVHAFSTVLWEILTGRRLFSGATEADTIAQVVKHEVPLVAELVPGTPAEVDAVLRRGLAEDLDERFATARDMCVALDTCGPMASTMQVADWFQTQAHELLERRSAIMSSIERDEGSGGAQLPRDGSGSAKEWIASLPDSGVSTRSMMLEAPYVDGKADGSISVVVDGFAAAKPRSWTRFGGALGVGIGLIGIAIAVIATYGHSSPPPATSAVSASPPPPTAAPVATNNASARPAPEPAPAAPVAATTAASAAEAATTTVAPRPSARPSNKASPARPRAPATNPAGVFDTRE
jgi:eukaryotic-like serine/threonine-protein kinase